MDAIVIKKYKNVWVRPDTADAKMVKECNDNYKDFNFDSESVVLDLGGNIGAFGVMALSAGIKHLIVYEPDVENCKMIELNLGDWNNKTIIRAAASVSLLDSVTFFQTESKNKDCSGTICPVSNRSLGRRKSRYSVPNENIHAVLEKYKPSHVKCDIEGSERDWIRELDGKFPSYVKEISFELHGGDFFHEFEDVHLDKFTKEFEVVNVTPNWGFASADKVCVLPKLGISVNGSLFGIDIFMRRK